MTDEDIIPICFIPPEARSSTLDPAMRAEIVCKQPWRQTFRSFRKLRKFYKNEPKRRWFFTVKDPQASFDMARVLREVLEAGGTVFRLSIYWRLAHADGRPYYSLTASLLEHHSVHTIADSPETTKVSGGYTKFVVVTILETRDDIKALNEKESS